MKTKNKMRYNKFLIFTLLVAACSGVKSPSVSDEVDYSARLDSMSKQFIGARYAQTPICTDNDIDYFSRLDSVSKQFIGVRYAMDPLGEGTGVDADPIIRSDVFDCVTYVETSMAYATPGDPIENKIKISYLDANPSYIYRKHFWEMDQAQSGTMTDITSKLGTPVKYVSGTIDKNSWFAKKNPPVKTDFETQKITLSYIASADIPKISMKRLPRVSIIGIIADSKDMPAQIGTNNWNRHVGFIVRDGDKVVVRHASYVAGKVIEQSWNDFINYQMVLKNRIGIKIWEIKNVQNEK